MSAQWKTNINNPSKLHFIHTKIFVLALQFRRSNCCNFGGQTESISEVWMRQHALCFSWTEASGLWKFGGSSRDPSLTPSLWSIAVVQIQILLQKSRCLQSTYSSSFEAFPTQSEVFYSKVLRSSSQSKIIHNGSVTLSPDIPFGGWALRSFSWTEANRLR